MDQGSNDCKASVFGVLFQEAMYFTCLSRKPEAGRGTACSSSGVWGQQDRTRGTRSCGAPAGHRRCRAWCEVGSKTDLLPLLVNLTRDRLRKLGVFILEKRRSHGDLIATLQYLKRDYQEAKEGHFIGICSDRTRTNGYKLKEGSLGWIVGRNSLL